MKKLIFSVLLPPGSVIVVLIIIGIFLKNNNILRLLAFAFALFIYLISIEPIKDFLFATLENFKTPHSLNGDVIVILGGGSYNSGFMKEDTLSRVIAGYGIYRAVKKPIIVSGGGDTTNATDAKLMIQFLRDMGVSEEFLIKEDKSKSTAENAFYVSKICMEKGYKKIILVTSGYHLKRAVNSFKKRGFEVIPYSADSKIDGKYTVFSFIPKYTVFANSVKALREHLAIIFTKMY